MSLYAGAVVDIPLLFDGDITVQIAGSELPATLTIPRHAKGLVVSTHGGGTSRYNPRYRKVASALNAARFATLLVDLLTEEEEAVDRRMAQLRFDVYLLGARLKAVTEWAKRDGALAHLPIGYLGTGTGSAAAFMAAAALPNLVHAVVSKGGRPDMAAGALKRSRAATLLLSGELDPCMIAVNEETYAQLNCEKHMIVVPGATQQFEEEGALEKVALLSRVWFTRHLAFERTSESLMFEAAS